ncbi:MAG TPA: hypothetical protein VM657_15205 [Sphingomonas sp.]|nr:hypothetical protein [Sphingomonas sp.]
MENGIGTPEAIGVITGAQLTLIVVLVLLVAFGIWWGTKRRRAQRRAEEEARQRREMAPPPPPVEEKRAAPPEPVAAPPPPPVSNEPIPASAPLEANPAAQAADEQVAPPPVAAEPAPRATPASAAGDGLADAPVTLIKGLGPKVAARLAENGITRVDQLAALSDVEAAALDAKLGNFAGRMARDRWLDQARLLAAGDRAGFEATFGKLG